MGSSLHLTKAVNLKIPVTVTAGWQQTVQAAGRVFVNGTFWGLYFFALFFSPCVMLPHAHAHVQISLLLVPSASFFSSPVTTSLSAQV